MAESEEKQEEAQEETTAVHEAETQHEHQKPSNTDEKESHRTEEPKPEEQLEKEEQISSAEKASDDRPPEPGEQKRRRSSGKRTSIDAKAKSMQLESFMPPESKRPSQSSESRRPSLVAGSRRPSPPFDKTTGKSARKSKFGALNSKARMVLGSIVDIKSNTAEYFDKRIAKFQNTYRLESENPFNKEKVDKILKEVMHEVLENLQYDPDKCASAAKFASTQIRGKVKQMEFDRYKLVCIVSIGEKNDQDVYATCRFLWDGEKDRYSFYSLENTHVYAIAHCFGLYYE